MAWSAALIDIGPRDNRIALAIVFTDNIAQKLVKEYLVDRGDVASIRHLAIAEVARLAAADTEKGKLAPLGPLDLTPDPPPTPDPDDVARVAFLAKWRLQQGYDRAVAAGLVATDDPGRATLAAQVAKDFLPAYLETM